MSDASRARPDGAAAAVEHGVAEVNGVRLHYESAGAGDPVVFVHGGGASLRFWRDELPAFSGKHRVVSYSRRYATPNRNPPVGDYNAVVDARDLEALIEALLPPPVHIIAASIGACAALFLTVRRPELVRSLVIAEPPMLRWANRTAPGQIAFAEFMRRAWEPTRAAFRDEGAEAGMRILLDHFVAPGTLDGLRPYVRARVLENSSDWQALAESSAPFPDMDPGDVARIRAPVLMLRADGTLPMHRIVDDELEQMLPAHEAVRIRDASHDMWADAPDQCRVATLQFLARIEKGGQ